MQNDTPHPDRPKPSPAPGDSAAQPLIAPAEPPPKPALGPIKWSKRRWFYTIALVFAAKVGIILFLEKPMEVAATPPRFNSTIVLAADPLSDRILAQLPDLADPTLFALASDRGFSGRAWLTFERPRHEWKAWDEPRRWLPLDNAGLGQTFHQFAASNTPPKLPPARWSVPGPTGTEVYVPSESIPTQSTVRVEGSLAHRKQLTPWELPSWPHGDLLSETIVHLLVDTEGYAISAAVLKESGSAQADQHALNQARQSRFTRIPPQSVKDPLSWGTLVFNWHTVSTNTLPPSPAPPDQ